ncbi:helix-turn-helix domain-containing protein [Marivirga arenosa]|uniref:Helix-turn-helix domain-containing protein n=1 Tax=Marivirga arenosa TaxID=3059076 RepID=A0AA49GDR4_9BACT|nr:helix-turn-helix domain-containing protein [Marivirga sp. BKB1-2]WKK80698.2 helix-turn-helix domain-containing protein [Marivirga sp. BKB1-2]
MHSSFLFVVVVISISVSLLLALFLFTLKSPNQRSNYLFATFLLLTAIDTSGYFYTSDNGLMTNLAMMRNLVIFLQLPTLYLYVLSACYSNFSLRPKHLVHTIPFIVVNLMFMPRFYLQGNEQKIQFLTNFKEVFEVQVNHVLLHLQVILYLVLIFLAIRKAKNLYLENNAGKKVQAYQWLFQLAFAISLFYAVALLKNIFKFSSYEHISTLLRASLYVFYLIIICWYLLKSLNNPGLFRNVDSKQKLVATLVAENKTVDKNDTLHNARIKQLNDYMLKEEPYLDPSINIQALSDKIELQARELSVLINHEIGLHFFDYINSFRIKKASQILSDPNNKQLTVLEVLYEVGFNSKSSFNTAFKKHTGFTPTEYRKKHL